MSAALCAMLSTVAAPVSAASAGVPPLEMQVTAAYVHDVATVTVRLSTSVGASCALRVEAVSLIRGFSRRSVGPSGQIVWRWDPSPPRLQRPWEFSARCSLAGYWRRTDLSAELGFPVLGGALDVGDPGAPSCNSQNVCFAEGPMIQPGQCGWYALGRRPDLEAIVSGDAGLWLGEARGRVPEGSVPVTGALAIFLPGVAGAGQEGHVAYVAAVSGSRILVDDSNWRVTPTSPGLQIHEHWMAADAPSGYIYGGPAGAGPA